MKTFEYFNFSVDTSGDTWTIDYEDKTYKHSEFNIIMNKVGSEGWELVSVTPMIGSNKPAFVEVSLTYTTRMIYYFKREITDVRKKIIDEEEKIAQKREKTKAELLKGKDISSLIKIFQDEGYLIKFQNDNRVILGRGVEEIRFDYNKAEDIWMQK